MPNLHQTPDAAADPDPPPPHPSQYMPPERFAQWAAELEYWAAERGLPPEPWAA